MGCRSRQSLLEGGGRLGADLVPDTIISKRALDTPLTTRQKRSREVEFTKVVIKAAWDRQGGRCAKCGRWLVWAQRGRDSVTGAWEPHNMNRAEQDGNIGLADCVILCAGFADCHFNEGHGGIDWSHHACLEDSALLFFSAGEQIVKMAPESSRKAGGRTLVGAFFGVSPIAEVKKRKTKRNPKGDAGATSAEGDGTELQAATDC
jgi:hypothetical protein